MVKRGGYVNKYDITGVVVGCVQKTMGTQDSRSTWEESGKSL